MMISIGLPVFNGEAYLEEAVTALLEQTHENLELIIADNASTDRTARIAASFLSRDDRVRLIRHDRNLGAVENYLSTLRAANGELFKWAAHDDVCHPTFVQRCIELLDDNPRAVLAYPRALEVDETGHQIGEVPSRPALASPDPATRLQEIGDLNSDVHPIFGVIRRHALESCRPHGKFAGADRVLLAELLLRGPFVEVPEPLFLFRKHSGQYSSAGMSSQFKTAFWTGEGTDRPQWANWQRLAGLRHAVIEAPLTATQRSSCRRVLARWVTAHWKRLVLDAYLVANHQLQRVANRVSST